METYFKEKNSEAKTEQKYYTRFIASQILVQPYARTSETKKNI